jgi:hypothetical protein
MARPTAIRGKKRRWISNVHTVSTYPPKGLFTKSAATISKTLASKRVSPKGPGSGCGCSYTSSTVPEKG